MINMQTKLMLNEITFLHMDLLWICMNFLGFKMMYLFSVTIESVGFRFSSAIFMQ